MFLYRGASEFPYQPSIQSFPAQPYPANSNHSTYLEDHASHETLSHQELGVSQVPCKRRLSLALYLIRKFFSIFLLSQCLMTPVTLRAPKRKMKSKTRLCKQNKLMNLYGNMSPPIGRQWV